MSKPLPSSRQVAPVDDARPAHGSCRPPPRRGPPARRLSSSRPTGSGRPASGPSVTAPASSSWRPAGSPGHQPGRRLVHRSVAVVRASAACSGSSARRRRSGRPAVIRAASTAWGRRVDVDPRRQVGGRRGGTACRAAPAAAGAVAGVVERAGVADVPALPARAGRDAHGAVDQVPQRARSLDSFCLAVALAASGSGPAPTLGRRESPGGPRRAAAPPRIAVGPPYIRQAMM